MPFLAKRSSLRASILAVVLLAAACGGASTDDVAVDSGAVGLTDDEGSTGDADSDETADTGDSEDAMSESDSDGGDIEDGDNGDGDAPSDEPADGGSEESAASSPPVSLPPEEAEAAASENLPNLQQSDDIRDLEILSVTSGGVTTLRDVVDGDRPVLLWFWAPH